MTTTELLPLILLGGGAFLLIGAAVHFTGVGSLNNIKSKTVGDGQHGTARWATKQEIQKTYRHIPFRPDLWRRGEDLPTAQGLVLGCVRGRGLKKPGKLAEKVRNFDFTRKIKLERTGLEELDLLSQAVEISNQNLLDSTLKMSHIMDLVGIPIGAFEYSPEGGEVQVTKQIFGLLNLPEEDGGRLYVDNEAF